VAGGREAVVTGTQRVVRKDCEILLRQIDGRLAILRAGRATEPTALDAAERTGEELRRLVGETARASAADRARVRAAVHYFASGGKFRTSAGRYREPNYGRRNEWRAGRSLGDDVRVVKEILGGALR
jgi:hypothetical protein